MRLSVDDVQQLAKALGSPSSGTSLGFCRGWRLPDAAWLSRHDPEALAAFLNPMAHPLVNLWLVPADRAPEFADRLAKVWGHVLTDLPEDERTGHETIFVGHWITPTGLHWVGCFALHALIFVSEQLRPRFSFCLQATGVVNDFGTHTLADMIVRILKPEHADSAPPTAQAVQALMHAFLPEHRASVWHDLDEHVHRLRPRFRRDYTALKVASCD